MADLSSCVGFIGFLLLFCLVKKKPLHLSSINIGYRPRMRVESIGLEIQMGQESGSGHARVELGEFGDTTIEHQQTKSDRNIYRSFTFNGVQYHKDDDVLIRTEECQSGEVARIVRVTQSDELEVPFLKIKWLSSPP